MGANRIPALGEEDGLYAVQGEHLPTGFLVRATDHRSAACRAARIALAECAGLPEGWPAGHQVRVHEVVLLPTGEAEHFTMQHGFLADPVEG